MEVDPASDNVSWVYRGRACRSWPRVVVLTSDVRLESGDVRSALDASASRLVLDEIEGYIRDFGAETLTSMT